MACQIKVADPGIVLLNGVESMTPMAPGRVVERHFICESSNELGYLAHALFPCFAPCEDIESSCDCILVESIWCYQNWTSDATTRGPWVEIGAVDVNPECIGRAD